MPPTAPQEKFTTPCKTSHSRSMFPKKHSSEKSSCWALWLGGGEEKSRPSLFLSSALWEVSPGNRRPLVSSQFKTDSHTEKTGTSPAMLSDILVPLSSLKYTTTNILANIFWWCCPHICPKLLSVRHGSSHGKQLRHKTFAENKEAIQKSKSQTMPCFKSTSQFTFFH